MFASISGSRSWCCLSRPALRTRAGEPHRSAPATFGATPGKPSATSFCRWRCRASIAGSIFTFSLTLGDYIVPQIIGPSSLILGQVVYAQQGLAGNIPLAAAFSVVPIVIMGLFLTAAKRMRGLRCALIATRRWG